MYHDSNRGGDAARSTPAPEPAELKQAADVLFGDGFWGRERVNPADAADTAEKADPARR